MLEGFRLLRWPMLEASGYSLPHRSTLGPGHLGSCPVVCVYCTHSLVNSDLVIPNCIPIAAYFFKNMCTSQANPCWMGHGMPQRSKCEHNQLLLLGWNVFLLTSGQTLMRCDDWREECPRVKSMNNTGVIWGMLVRASETWGVTECRPCDAMFESSRMHANVGIPHLECHPQCWTSWC